jgi:hypothetical protein
MLAWHWEKKEYSNVALKWSSLWLRMGKLLHAGMALGKEGIFNSYKLKKGRKIKLRT